MALSQKHVGKILVPWFNCDEWKTVYKLIFSSNGDQQAMQEGLQILKIWKKRSTLLSSGIEGTLIVVDALLQDQTKLSEATLRSIYGGALMRFLNLCAANSNKQGTFYETAKRNKIPDWMIDLRHDFAHAHELPSFSVLTLALEYSLNWLEKEYWSVQKDVISDWIVEELDPPDLQSLENMFASLCDITQKMYRNEEVEVDESLHINIENEKKFVSKSGIKYIQSVVLRKIKADYSNVNHSSLVSILLDKSDMLNPEHLMADAEEVCVPKDLLQSWEHILVYFNERNLLCSLLENLFLTLNNMFCSATTKDLVALWITEIVKGILKQKILKDRRQSKLTKSSNEGVESGNGTVEPEIPFATLNLKHYPSEMIKPMEEFKNKFLNSPNKHTLQFLKPALQICNYSEDHIADMEKLIKMATSLDPSTMKQIENILGVDFKTAMKDFEMVVDNDDESTVNNSEEYVNVDNISQELRKTKRWQKITDTAPYKGLPLGVMPGQNRDRNPILFVESE